MGKKVREELSIVYSTFIGKIFGEHEYKAIFEKVYELIDSE